MAYYITHFSGLDKADSYGDGYSINLKWFTAYPSNQGNVVATNIYFSTNEDNVFLEGPKYVYTGSDSSIRLFDFEPGELYFFAIRPIEYNPLQNPFTMESAYDDLKAYPSSALSTDITATDVNIPIVDTSSFPSTGTVIIGSELITYQYVNTVDGYLGGATRGYNSIAASHTVDGYDGYTTWEDYRKNVTFFVSGETKGWDVIIPCKNRFEYPNYAFTHVDGYRQKTQDITNIDLTASDEENSEFRSYDYAGYHKITPVHIVSSECVGSYIGGEMYCHDDNTKVGRVVRGVPLQERIIQRQEMLLSATGVNTVLLQKMNTGIKCSCVLPNMEYPDDRCIKCYGAGFVLGYVQYFNPRESHGRIKVRFDPMEEDNKLSDNGIDTENTGNAWTLTIPTIRDRDILIKYGMDDQEECRYEVLSVTRNNTFLSLQGGQKMRVQKINRTDPIYRIKVFSNTATMPEWLNTETSLLNNVSHFHQIRKNENNPSTWQQQSTVSPGHQHQVVFLNGVLTLLPVLNHTHTLVI